MILRLKDRVSLKVGDIEFIIAPLSNLQKTEILGATYMEGGEEKIDLIKYQSSFLKHSLKDAIGLKDYFGNNYKLQFAGDCLTDDCISELFAIEQRPVIIDACAKLMSGLMPEIEGVEVKAIEGK